MLDSFESELNTRLPDDYREFLLEWNGGNFEEQAELQFLDHECGEDNAILNQLSGLFDEKNIYDLRRSSEAYGFRQDVVPEYIAIGASQCENMPCISIAGDDFGWVYYWTPGEPWPPGPPSRSFLRPCASSFSAFWDRLGYLVDL